MEYRTIGFKKQVSLALLAIDDFTDQVITGSQIRMYTEEGGKPSVRKAEGYHVFCNLEGEKARICAEGPLYQRQVAEFPLKGASEVFQVRMLPAACYPIPAGATCVRGSLRPGSRIRLLFPEQKKSYKLLYDYEPEKQGAGLLLFCPESVHLEGKTLCIRDAAGEQEFFQVEEHKGEACRMKAALKKAYRKIGTSVYPVYEAKAGADGTFYLPIRSLSGDEGPCLCLLEDGEEELIRYLTLTPGRENRITEAIYREGS